MNSGLLVEVKKVGEPRAHWFEWIQGSGWQLREQTPPAWTRLDGGTKWLIRVKTHSLLTGPQLMSGAVQFLTLEYLEVIARKLPMTLVCDLHWEAGIFLCHFLWFWVPARYLDWKWNRFYDLAAYLQPLEGLHMPLRDPIILYNLLSTIPTTCRLSFNHIGDIYVCVSILLVKYCADRKVQLLSATNTPMLSKYAHIVHLDESLYTARSPPACIDIFFASCRRLLALPVPKPPARCSLQVTMPRTQQVATVVAEGLTLTRDLDQKQCVLRPIVHEFVNNPALFPMTLTAGTIVDVVEYHADRFWLLAVTLSNGQWWFVDWDSFQNYSVQTIELDAQFGGTKYTATFASAPNSETDIQMVFHVQQDTLVSVERYVRTKC
jgi:hypothetical protein